MRKLLVAFLALLAFPALAAVDINAADVGELERLPGIGPSKAAAIVQYRTDHGPFKSVDELDNVSGIGPSTLASLREHVTVGKGGAAPSGTASGGASSTASTATASTKGASDAPAAPAASAGAGCPVNINKADAAGMKDMPGIGDSKAAAIVQYRTDHGPFPSCDALDEVSGIGPATIANLRDCCTVK